MTIRVGTCGFSYYDPGEAWQDRYQRKQEAPSDSFSVGGRNRTFYSFPMVSTVERRREEIKSDFEFTMKAWQAMTHTWDSPTWNGHRDDVAEDRTPPWPTSSKSWNTPINSSPSAESHVENSTP